LKPPVPHPPREKKRSASSPLLWRYEALKGCSIFRKKPGPVGTRTLPFSFLPFWPRLFAPLRSSFSVSASRELGVAFAPGFPSSLNAPLGARPRLLRLCLTFLHKEPLRTSPCLSKRLPWGANYFAGCRLSFSGDRRCSPTRILFFQPVFFSPPPGFPIDPLVPCPKGELIRLIRSPLGPVLFLMTRNKQNYFHFRTWFLPPSSSSPLTLS